MALLCISCATRDEGSLEVLTQCLIMYHPNQEPPSGTTNARDGSSSEVQKNTHSADFTLLGYDFASVGKRIPIFVNNVLSSS